VHGVLLRCCPFWWAIDRCEGTRGRDRARVVWVLGWLVALIVMWVINPAGALNDVFAVLASLRLLEVFTTGLGTVLDRHQQARARSLITIAIYALQVTFIFAIVDHSWAGSAFVTNHGTHATHKFDFLYISWTDMTTRGNTYAPQGVAARMFQMLTTTSGLLLLGVLLAFGINRLPKDGEATELAKLEELYRSGALQEAEFQAVKKRIINGN
jgi:hypothetical protein